MSETKSTNSHVPKNEIFLRFYHPHPQLSAVKDKNSELIWKSLGYKTYLNIITKNLCYSLAP